MSQADRIRQQLETHGRARLEAGQRRKRETAAIKVLAPKAVAAGLSKSEIASLALISRPTLDAMLGEDG